MVKCKIKQGDLVIVLAGKDKGKTSNVRRVLYKKNKLVLDGLNLVKCFNKKKRTLLGRGKTKEMPISISNVAHVDPKTKKATRTRIMFKDGKKFLVAQKSGDIIREISKSEVKESANV